MKRALSFILIFMGILLLYWGYDLHQRMDTVLIRNITGQYPEQVWQYFVTGSIALLLGAWGAWKYRG